MCALCLRKKIIHLLDKVAGEWDLVALAYNCKRLHNLKMEMEMEMEMEMAS